MTEVVSSAQNKKTIFIIATVVSVLVIAASVYFLVTNKVREQGVQVAPPVVPETLDVVSKIDELTNPVGDKLPDLNPVEKINPFKDVYKNPFE